MRGKAAASAQACHRRNRLLGSARCLVIVQVKADARLMPAGRWRRAHGRQRVPHLEEAHMTIGLRVLLAALAVLAAWPSAASAQTKLKWAHVYEVAEPYHTQAAWAGEEIKKRSNGKYQIDVFPASQLGNENQINEALGLGTVDMIYTGVAFAGSIHKPIAITNAPFVLRDFEHWKLYRDSQLFRDIAKGYEDKTEHKVITLTYYGQRMVTANKEIKKPEDMKGMKLRVPPAPLFLMFTKSVGANATPIAFAEVYLALQQGTVDGQENPLPTIMAKKFYEVQSHIMLTGHITESLLTILGSHVWAKLNDDEKKIFNEVLMQAAANATDQIRASEQKLADEFRKLGKNVVEVDRAAFRTAALPLHNDGSGGWSQAEYDALQALK
jgi:tripartite ATP-independent transporter DctP family solute receptor